MHTDLRDIGSIKLSRKEFIMYVGAIFVGLLGMPTILKLISDISKVSHPVKTATSDKRRFGSGAYGV